MKVDPSVETYQVGAHFKALNEAVLMALFKTLEDFFFHFKSLGRSVLILEGNISHWLLDCTHGVFETIDVIHCLSEE